MTLSPPTSSTSTSTSNSQQQDIFHQWQNTPALRSLRGTSTSVSHPINFTTHQSLMILIHFIGDIHQLLHVSQKSDIGGNSIHVTFPFLLPLLTSISSCIFSLIMNIEQSSTIIVWYFFVSTRICYTY
jgi:hypothetical protein